MTGFFDGISRAEVEALAKVDPAPGIPLEEFIGPRKPCPFCGSTNLKLNCWEEYVVCQDCDASAPVNRWQFRTPQP